MTHDTWAPESQRSVTLDRIVLDLFAPGVELPRPRMRRRPDNYNAVTTYPTGIDIPRDATIKAWTDLWLAGGL